MIEINVSTLIGCTDALNELIKKPLKIRTAYKIARLAREIQKELELFNSAKISLVRKYGEQDEKGELAVNENNDFQIKKEYKDIFIKEFQDMMEQKLSFDKAQSIEILLKTGKCLVNSVGIALCIDKVCESSSCKDVMDLTYPDHVFTCVLQHIQHRVLWRL